MTENFNITMNNTIKRFQGLYVEDEASKKGFGTIYPFTTENISGYINEFDLKDKSLLTVGSSGDQAINAILNDCKDITVLDINSYTKFYYFLKISCILELEISELLQFLRYKDYPRVFKDNNNAFNIETFNKIKSTLRLLDYESYLFWDKLFQTFPGNKIRIKLFTMDENRTGVIICCNQYLQGNILYNETREKIKKVNVNFINSDIFKTDLDRSFDNIWLSNIGTCLSIDDIKLMIDKNSRYLIDDGKLLISYLYDTTIDTKYQNGWHDIYNLNKTFEILSEYAPELISFTGIDDLKSKSKRWNDSILVYKKTNKQNML